MNRKKFFTKIITVFLAVVVFFSFTAISLADFENYICTLDASQKKAAAGDKITLTLSLRGIHGADSGDILITFDDKNLLLTDAKIYGINGECLCEGGYNLNVPHTVSFTFATKTPIVSTNCTAAKYTFLVLNSGTFDFKVSECDIYRTKLCANGKHNFKTVKTTKSATCTRNGEAIGECTKCGMLKTIQTAKRAHNYNNFYFSNGKIWASCAVCKNQLETDYIVGDVVRDGQITSKDARKTLRIAARIDPPTDYEFFIGDVVRDGQITSKDARKILRVSARLEKM